MLIFVYKTAQVSVSAVLTFFESIAGAHYTATRFYKMPYTKWTFTAVTRLFRFIMPLAKLALNRLLCFPRSGVKYCSTEPEKANTGEISSPHLRPSQATASTRRWTGWQIAANIGRISTVSPLSAPGTVADLKHLKPPYLALVRCLSLADDRHSLAEMITDKTAMDAFHIRLRYNVSRSDVISGRS